MKQDETETFERNRIAQLLDRLLEHQRSIKEERRKLWHSEKGSQEQYTVLDRLDILSADIIGYASGIASKGYTVQEPNEVINHLHRLSIFNVECIMNWYTSAEEEYPKIKHYFELLDYIRLLTLEYIERYRLKESAQY
jgi:hypothetical protein